MTGMFGVRHGTMVNTTRAALAQRRATRKQVEKVPNPEPAVVTRYDFANQRVNVRFKNRPNEPELLGIPIGGTGGTFVHIRALKTGDLGILIPTWSDSRDSWLDRDIRRPRTLPKNEGRSWIFRPDPPQVSSVGMHELMNDTAGDADKLCGPNDSALLSRDGRSGVIFKNNGKVLFIGDSFELLERGNGSTPARIAREGDAVSTPEGGGTITGGSDIARSH